MTAGKLGYSIAEAAGQLGIGRSLMCELIARGDLRSVKIGSRRIVPADSLREYLAELVRQQAPDGDQLTWAR
jgi:excisionase family DNA binding protein